MNYGPSRLSLVNETIEQYAHLHEIEPCSLL